MSPPATPAPFEVYVQRDACGVRILLSGEFDSSVLWRLDEVVDAVASTEEEFVIDCEHLEFIDAGGIGAFVRAHALGATVDGARGRVQRILDLVDLTTVLGDRAVTPRASMQAVGHLR